MPTVILTIVFLSSPSTVEQMSTLEVRDMGTCEAVAETWRRWPGGMLRVLSATCAAPRVG